MSERLDNLKKARDRMVEDRFARTPRFLTPRPTATRRSGHAWKFVEIQVLVDAIDRAIAGDQATS